MGKAEVIGALTRYDSFIVTSHVNMEGDSIGSQLAMARLLKKMGKRSIILHDEPVPCDYRFLVGPERFNSRLKKKDTFDAIVILDCPVVGRVGISERAIFKRAKCVINIDHHISNTNYGKANWVEPHMSSCGELLFHLFRDLAVDFDKCSSLSLYVAILTDTGAFGYENTTPDTHKVVARLLEEGIHPLSVKNMLEETKSLNELMLLKAALGTLRLHCDGKVATMYTTAGMLRRFKLDPEKTDNFVNYARSIKTAKVALFFLEHPGRKKKVHVSFRSKGEVDVNRLATMFNGGGHRNASGCHLDGSVADAKKLILSKVRSEII